jgi:hypothetical protein
MIHGVYSPFGYDRRDGVGPGRTHQKGGGGRRRVTGTDCALVDIAHGAWQGYPSWCLHKGRLRSVCCSPLPVHKLHRNLRMLNISMNKISLQF